MRKRRELAKYHILVSGKKPAQILHVEELICESHRQKSYRMKKLL